MNKIRIVVADLKDDLISILKYRDFIEDLGPYTEFLSQFSDKFKRVALWFKVRNFSDADIQSYVTRFERLNVNVSISRNSLAIGNKRFIDKKEDTHNYLEDFKIELAEFIDHEYPMLPTIQVTKDIIDLEPNQVVNGISVYGIEDISDAAAVGRDTTWCITKPGNGMLQSYRDGSGATFIIIVDQNQQHPFSKVAVQYNTGNVVLLTDLRNRTGRNFTQPFIYNGRNYGSSWDGYQAYLKMMGVDFNQKRINPYTKTEELLFANRPLSAKENEINKTINQYYVSLQTFISWINSPDNLASRHIGLGKQLSDEVFDYIKSKNQLLPLLQQYVSTGIKLPDQQEDYIFTKNQLRNTYIHSQLVAHEQGVRLNTRIVNYLDPKNEKHLKVILDGIKNTESLTRKQKLLEKLVFRHGYRFDNDQPDLVINYCFMKPENFRQILEEYPELNQEEFLELNKACNLDDINPSEFTIQTVRLFTEVNRSYQPIFAQFIQNARLKLWKMKNPYQEDIPRLPSSYVRFDNFDPNIYKKMNEWPEQLLDEVASDKTISNYILDSDRYELIPKDNKLKKNLNFIYNYLGYRRLTSEKILEHLPEELQNVEFYKSIITLPQDSNYLGWRGIGSNVLINILPLIPNEYKDEELLLNIHQIYDLSKIANINILDFPEEARTEKILNNINTHSLNINLILFFNKTFIKMIDRAISSNEYVYPNYDKLSLLKNYYRMFFDIEYEDNPDRIELMKKISEINHFDNKSEENKYEIWTLPEQTYINIKGLILSNQIDPIFSLHIINDYITNLIIQKWNKTLDIGSTPVFVINDFYPERQNQSFFSNFIDFAELKDPTTGIPLSRAQKIHIFKTYNENQELLDVLDEYDIDRDISYFIGFEDYLEQEAEYSEFAESLGNSMAEEAANRARARMTYCYQCDEERWDGETCGSCGYPDYNCPECGQSRDGQNEDCNHCGYPDYPCPNCGEHGYSEDDGCDSCGQGRLCPQCDHTPYIDGENCGNCGYPNPCPECGEEGYDEDDGCEHCGYGKNCPNCGHTPYIDGDDCENCGYPDNLPEDEIEEEVEASYKAYIKIASVLDQKGMYRMSDKILSKVK